MSDEPIIILKVPSSLSDEAAFSMCEFFYDFAATFENHYMYQLKRHARELEKEIPAEGDWVSADEDPF